MFERLKAKTPKFFRRLRATGTAIGASCAIGLATPNLPEYLSNYLEHGIGLGVMMGVISSFAKDDKVDNHK